MNSLEVKNVLGEKCVRYLYHANSVLTSISYLEHGGIMSREYTENCGYPQTPQQSDDTDRLFDIYNDIFLDSVDVHEYSKNVNHYGPVLFVYSLDVLDEVQDFDVCVTRINAMYRLESNVSESQRYYEDSTQLRASFVKGNFGQSITIRHISQPLSFDHLVKIIIDDPGEDKKAYLDNALYTLKPLLKRIGKENILEIRHCDEKCRCLEVYNNYKEGYTYHRFKTEE